MEVIAGAPCVRVSSLRLKAQTSGRAPFRNMRGAKALVRGDPLGRIGRVWGKIKRTSVTSRSVNRPEASSPESSDVDTIYAEGIPPPVFPSAEGVAMQLRVLAGPHQGAVFPNDTVDTFGRIGSRSPAIEN